MVGFRRCEAALRNRRVVAAVADRVLGKDAADRMSVLCPPMTGVRSCRYGGADQQATPPRSGHQRARDAARLKAAIIRARLLEAAVRHTLGAARPVRVQPVA